LNSGLPTGAAIALTLCKKMKSIDTCAIGILIAFSCFSCEKNDSPQYVTSSTAPWLDISIDGQRYYGLALMNISSEPSQSEFSCVILSPWDGRPGTLVGVKGDVSTITLPSGEFKIVGRRVCTTTPEGDSVTVYPGEIPIEAFSSREGLENATIQIMKKHNKPDMATPRKPSD
jgi:hypothetical protein